MPGLKDWNPYETHVQGGLREGNFLNGQFVLLCAGPPHLADLGGSAAAADAANSEGNDVVYPIGLTQNIALSQNKAVSRMFEIGSERSYFITGRTIGQLSLSRVMYHGPSLLRCLYAYYNTGSSSAGLPELPVDPLYISDGAIINTNHPFIQGDGEALAEDGTSKVRLKSGLHGIKVPPGFDNVFINLASDLFSQPIGLLLVFRDNEENNVASVYLEQCYVPTHSLALDSQGLIIQESVGIQYERLVPIQGTSVRLVDKILSDPVGLGASLG